MSINPLRPLRLIGLWLRCAMTVHPDLLHAVPLLAGLKSGQRELLAGLFEERSYPRGAIIFQEGEPCTGLHILAGGRVKLCRRTANREHILELAGRGAVLDTVPILDEGPHSVTAEVMDPAVVLTLSPEEARRVLDSYPELLHALLQAASHQLRELAEHVSELAFKDVTTRLSTRLSELAARDGVKVEDGILLRQKLTQQELAALVGTAREVVARALRKLETDGVIRVEGRQIVVVDLEKLRKISSS